MKYLSLLLVLFLSGCPNYHSDELVYDVDLRIIRLGELGHGEDRVYNYCIPVLFETTTLPKKFVSFDTCDKGWTPRIGINRSWISRHREGDIIHFDYLRKDRFFDKNTARPKK